MDADRNLLFGILALRNGLIDEGQFVAACEEWASRKSTPIAEILEARGWITAEDRADIDRFVRLNLRRHSDDPGRTLTAVSAGDPLRLLDGMNGGLSIHSTVLADDATRDGHVLLSTIAHGAKSSETRDRYTLTTLHAEGGLGRVWLAHDPSMERDVALKELLPETETKEPLRARFVEEAKITGKLQHPAIVPVHELNPGSKGRSPYYTMRFVKGGTLRSAIHEFHKDREKGAESSLKFRGLLNDFVTVCNAISYAHFRRVIHRDLKGENIILGDFGEVVVLDWGLAKLLDAGKKDGELADPIVMDLDPARGVTINGKAIGTPAYMPPEQAEGDHPRIGERSDVYSLGVILYEIICGKLPLNVKVKKVEELRRVIREEVPASPRSHWSDAPPALAAVCMKAIQKDPKDRYARVSDLAEEVKRWLADEPVDAYPEPWTVRAGRWARRHRSAVVGAAVFLIVSVIGLAISTAIFGELKAKAEHEWARAEDEKSKAERARDEVERGHELASNIADDVLGRSTDDLLATTPGAEETRRKWIDDTASKYHLLLLRFPQAPFLICDAAQVDRRAATAHKTMNRFADARTYFDRSVAALRGLVQAHPSVRRYRDRLAETLIDRASLVGFLSGPEAAIPIYREAIALEKELKRDDPVYENYDRTKARAEHDMADAHIAVGNLTEAIEPMNQSVAALERLARARPKGDDPMWLALVLEGRSELHRRLGRQPEAQGDAQTALGLAVEQLKLLPDDNNRKYTKAVALAVRGRSRSGDPRFRADEATRDLSDAIDILDHLATGFTKVPRYRQVLGRVLLDRGVILSESGRADRAREDWLKARDLARGLADSIPDPNVYDGLLGQVLSRLGRLEVEQGHVEDGRKLLKESIDRLDRASRRNAKNPDDLDALAKSRAALASKPG